MTGGFQGLYAMDNSGKAEKDAPEENNIQAAPVVVAAVAPHQVELSEEQLNAAYVASLTPAKRAEVLAKRQENDFFDALAKEHQGKKSELGVVMHRALAASKKTLSIKNQRRLKKLARRANLLPY